MNPPTEADGFVSSLRAGPPARHRALGPADPARTAELAGSDLFVRSSRSVWHTVQFSRCEGRRDSRPNLGGRPGSDATSDDSTTPGGVNRLQVRDTGVLPGSNIPYPYRGEPDYSGQRGNHRLVPDVCSCKGLRCLITPQSQGCMGYPAGPGGRRRIVL